MATKEYRLILRAQTATMETESLRRCIISARQDRAKLWLESRACCKTLQSVEVWDAYVCVEVARYRAALVRRGEANMVPGHYQTWG